MADPEREPTSITETLTERMSPEDIFFGTLAAELGMIGASPSQLLAAKRAQIERHYAESGGEPSPDDIQTLEGLAALERGLEE